MSQPDIRLDVPYGTAASTTLLLDQTGRDDAFLRWAIVQGVGGDRLRLPEATTAAPA